MFPMVDDGKEEYIYGEAKCKCCGYEWVAVCHIDTEFLQCPNCEKICGALKENQKDENV